MNTIVNLPQESVFSLSCSSLPKKPKCLSISICFFFSPWCSNLINFDQYVLVYLLLRPFSHLPEDAYLTRTSPIATKGKKNNRNISMNTVLAAFSIIRRVSTRCITARTDTMCTFQILNFQHAILLFCPYLFSYFHFVLYCSVIRHLVFFFFLVFVYDFSVSIFCFFGFFLICYRRGRPVVSLRKDHGLTLSCV